MRFNSIIKGDVPILCSKYFNKNGANSFTTGYTGLGVYTSGTTDSFGLYFGNGNVSGFNFNNASSYTYTFPSTSGTVALTSNLSSYLPLSGGTLTGGLTGTTANFLQTISTIGTNTSLDTTISKYFKNLMNCIYEMYEKCKNYSSK